MPSGGGLGIHLTLDTGGGARFGPDINWDAPSYDVDPARHPAFMRASRNTGLILRSMILCRHGRLRPKIIPDGSRFADFTFLTESDHGAANVTALHGIDLAGADLKPCDR